MIKIDIFISNFGNLGAQRVAINMANFLKSFYEVNFVVLDMNGPFKNYLMNDINIINLSAKNFNIPKIRVFTRALAYSNYVKTNKTNIAISFSPITNFYIIFAKFYNRRLKTIIQEHAYPSIALKDRGNASLLYQLFFKHFLVKFYNKTDIFITIANAIKEDFINNYNVRSNLIRIVRNPLDIHNINTLKNEEIDDFVFNKEKKYLIGVGRLSTQKNFKRLIDIFSKVYKINKKVELIILGDGSLYNYLKDYSTKLGLKNKIHLLGFKPNPYKYIAKSDIFCLTSDWEGLPQVIAETMICRTLIIAHKCKSGPEEMISNNETGMLVEYDDIDDFANKIIFSLEHQQEIQMIVENAYKFATNEYSLENIGSKYLEIIEELNKKK
jgi:glycosyltransferase involved in cell wall biosynthesis